MRAGRRKYQVVFTLIGFNIFLVLSWGFLLSGCVILPTSQGSIETVTVENTVFSPTITLQSTSSVRVTPVPSSPNELSIAYLDFNQQLWLASIDGYDRLPLTCTGKVLALAWSPDGTKLAYVCELTKNARYQVRIYALATQHRYELDVTMEHLSQLLWSPDSRYLTLDGGTGIVRTLKFITTTTMQVVQELTALGYAWSPDGQYLAVGQRQPLTVPLSVAPVDSVSLAVWQPEQNHLTYIFTGTATFLYFPKAWDVDTGLIYDRLEWNETTQTGHHTLWRVTYDDVGVRETQPFTNTLSSHNRESILARLPVTLQNATLGAFSWSPDGQQVVFQVGVGKDAHIYVLNWETETHAPVYLFPGNAPQWRPAITSTKRTLEK